MSDSDHRKLYDEARDYWNEWRRRAEEDLRFSNPANPQQWEPERLKALGRAGVGLVFDQTNQYIGQVVNDARQNKPSIDVLPGDSEASDEAAEVYGGLWRYYEYASRAQIAYDTGIEYAARIGLGYVLIVPELVDARTNDHELRIKAVHNPLAATLDPDSVEPDGQDADCGWLETGMSKAAFKRRWPKAKEPKPSGDRWVRNDGIVVCQHFNRTYEQKNRILTQDGRDFTEDEYHKEGLRVGAALPVHETFMSSTPLVKWQWLSGEEVLEETDYPAPWIGLVPMYGNVLWVDGKREVCGMTRRMMDACRAYNYSRSAEIEAMTRMPKSPWLVPAAAISKYQALWDNANTENRAALPYDHKDADGQPLPPPVRQDPPQLGTGYAMLSQAALQDVQASVGMYKSSLGQNSNASSGKAIGKLETQSDTATFHYLDNEARTIEQVGRIGIALMPHYLDREKIIRILGEDGKPRSVKVDPALQTAHAGRGVDLVINPKVGQYAVRVKVGPSYSSKRQEVADRLAAISQGNPQLGAALAPLMLQMDDMPGADKVAKVAMAMLPPEIRAAYEEDDGQPEVPPQLMAQMQQLQGQNQEMDAMLQKAADEIERLKAENESNFNDQLIKAYDAETKRIQALGAGMSPEEVRALAMQTVFEAMQSPGPEPIPPDSMAAPLTDEPAPPAGFSLGEQITPPAMAATGAQPGPGFMPDLSEGLPNV